MWIDTHAHLSDEVFELRLEEVLLRAREASVHRMLCVGTNLRTSKACLDLANQHDQLFSSAGIHPNYAHQASESDWMAIEQLLSHPRVVAVGETGLDKYWDDCPWDLQVESFQRQIAFSRQFNKPLIIHTRECEKEMVELLEDAVSKGPIRGVMHSFVGSLETAQRCLDIGMYISFAGMLTYKKSNELRNIASQIPLDRLLVETDCPYLSPEPKRSIRPNEPSHVVYTAHCLATCKNIEVEELAEITTQNATKLFQLPAE